MVEKALDRGIRTPVRKSEIIQSTAPVLLAELVDGREVYLRHLTLPRIPRRRRLLVYNGYSIGNVGDLMALQLPLRYQRTAESNETLKLDLSQFEVDDLMAALTPDGRFFCREVGNIDALHELISCLKKLGSEGFENPDPKPSPFLNKEFIRHMEFQAGRPVALTTIKDHFLHEG